MTALRSMVSLRKTDTAAILAQNKARALIVMGDARFGLRGRGGGSNFPRQTTSCRKPDRRWSGTLSSRRVSRSGCAQSAVLHWRNEVRGLIAAAHPNPNLRPCNSRLWFASVGCDPVEPARSRTKGGATTSSLNKTFHTGLRHSACLSLDV